MSVQKLTCILAIAVLFVGSTLFTNSTCAATPPDETKNLKTAVEKLKLWLGDSPERAGWQNFLFLRHLNTQSALGNQADLAILQQIQTRFHSDTSGLNHPVFQGVKNALDDQIKRLSASRQSSIPQLLADAKSGYTAPAVEVIQQQRDRVIADIDALIRHYRTTMPSRKRALLFYDLQLDRIKSFLTDLTIEVAPEVSVSKLDSMIRDVQKEIDRVVEEIDAIPITPEPDNDESEAADQDNNDNQSEDGEASAKDASNGLSLISPPTDPSGKILFGQGPSEDQDEATLEELETKMETLEAKKKVLRQRRKKILKADLPRLRERAKTVRQLRKYEAAFDQVARQYGDPYFVIAKASLTKFSVSFLNGTSGNLQEDMLNRLDDVEDYLQDITDPEKARTASGKLGDSLRWLDDAGQTPSLVTAVRSKHSQPNAYLSIRSDLINNLVAQTISDRSPLRQKAFGRLVRGCTETNGNVTLQLIDDPNQIQARLRLDASVASDAFVQEGKVQVFTNSHGTISADRRISIGLDGVQWDDTQVDARFQSTFAGTNSKFGFVNRIAEKAFTKNQSRADEFTEGQARDQALTQFNERTEKPLSDANQQLVTFQQKALNKSNMLPAIRLNSTHDRINVVVKQETNATLAAPDRPHEFGVNPQVSLRIHDTILSNYLDPMFSGKTFTNEELAAQIELITGEAPAGLVGENEDGEPVEEFSIGFTRIRPIQIEFEEQTIRVVVSGQRFSQGGNKINAGMKIMMNFKVHNEGGQLKFGRDGKVEFEFIDPKRTTPALIAFRRLLDENLNENKETDQVETDLPANFIPVDQVPALADSPIAKQLRLVQFRSDNGWLYLGWNRETNASEPFGWIYDLPAIWNR